MVMQSSPVIFDILRFRITMLVMFFNVMPLCTSPAFRPTPMSDLSDATRSRCGSAI
jgi:hypothetical protein